VDSFLLIRGSEIPSEGSEAIYLDGGRARITVKIYHRALLF
jgi:hypothetical protein